MVPFASLILCAASAACAAAGAWVLGRGLRRVDRGPGLAERLQRHRGRLTLVVVAASVAPLVALPLLELVPLAGPWLLPVLLALFFVNSFAAMAGDFPVRRVLFEESWSLGTYLRAALRGSVGLLGFWLVVLTAPFAVAAAGPYAWLAAVPACAGLLLWSRRFPRVTMALLGARPLDDPDLAARFEAILGRSTARRPVIGVFGRPEGSLANAFALPSATEPGVLFTRPLLQRLTPDETAAIFAHEVAHLEDFAGRTLRRLRVQEDLLLVAGCFGAPLAALAPAPALTVFLWAWMFVVLVGLARRARGMQAKETESDRRAVQLCGDPEALVRGLVKVHASNLMPRRLAADVERLATHPSLARRIRDIRGEAAPAPAAPEDLFVARGGGAAWLLDDRRLARLTLPKGGAPATPEEARAAATAEATATYSALVELRTAPSGGGFELHAVERGGAKHVLKLVDGDVARAEARLDRVDGQLAPLAGFRGRSARGHVALLTAVLACAALLGMGVGLFAPGPVVALLLGAVGALAARSRPWLTAAGLMAAGGALVRLVFPAGFHAGTLGYALLALTLLAGLGLLVRARARHPAPLADGRPMLAGLVFVLLGLAFVALAVQLVHGDGALRGLHVLGLHRAAAFLPLLGAAGALWTDRRCGVKAAACVLGLVGLAHTGVGGSVLLERALDDPLLADAPPLAVDEAAYDEIATVALPATDWDVRVAPGGARVLSLAGGRVRVTEADGTHRLVPAHAGAFAGPDRLLLVVDGEARLVPVADSARVLWRAALEDFDGETDADCVADAARWRVVTGRGARTTSRYTGTFTSPAVDRATWTAPLATDRWRHVGAGPAVLEAEWGGDANGATRLFLRGPDGRRALAASRTFLDLQDGGLAGDSALCMVFGLVSWRVWRFDLATGAMTPLCRLRERGAWRRDGVRFAFLESRRLVVAREGGRGIAIPLPAPADGADLALARGAAAVVRRGPSALRVTVIRLPE